MKKLDEIMELMTDEMDEFKKDLLQLQKLSNDLQKRSIPITTEVLEKQLFFFFQKQKKRDALTAEALKAIDQKLKKSYILPKSLGILFGGCLILLVTLNGYLVYQVVGEAGPNNNQVVKKETTTFFNRYFLENPKVKEDYEKWLQNQNSP